MKCQFSKAASAICALSIAMFVVDPVLAQRGGRGGGGGENRGGGNKSGGDSRGGGENRGGGGEKGGGQAAREFRGSGGGSRQWSGGGQNHPSDDTRGTNRNDGQRGKGSVESRLDQIRDQTRDLIRDQVRVTPNRGNQDGRRDFDRDRDWRDNVRDRSRDDWRDDNRWSRSDQNWMYDRNPWNDRNRSQWSWSSRYPYTGRYGNYGWYGGRYGNFYSTPYGYTARPYGYYGNYYGPGYGYGLGGIVGLVTGLTGLGAYGVPGIGLGYGGYYGSYGPYGYSGYNRGYAAPYVVDNSSRTETYVTTRGSAESFLESGRAAFLAGDYATAQRDANHAVVESPQNPKAHELMMLAMFAQGEFQGSAAAAHAVADLGAVPDWPTLYGYYKNRDKYVQHLEKLQQFARENPDAAEAKFLLGFNYQMLGHQEQAENQFAQYLKQVQGDDPIAVKLFSDVGGDVATLPRPEANVPVRSLDHTIDQPPSSEER